MRQSINVSFNTHVLLPKKTINGTSSATEKNSKFIYNNKETSINTYMCLLFIQ